MPYYLVQSFKDGIDRRREQSATNAGALWKLENAHVTPGGDIEKRLAFVDVGGDFAGTVGLASIDSTAFVFGSAQTPPKPWMLPFQAGTVLTPNTVVYMPLDISGNGNSITEIVDWELFDGRMYVTARTDMGAVLHFYDGKRVPKGRGQVMRTYKNKIYGVQDTGVLDFSAISDPTTWNEFAAAPISGTVDTPSKLPGTYTVGDTYFVSDTKRYWRYTVNGWVDLGTSPDAPAIAGYVETYGELPKVAQYNDCWKVQANGYFYGFQLYDDGTDEGILSWVKRGTTKPNGVRYLGIKSKISDLPPSNLTHGLVYNVYGNEWEDPAAEGNYQWDSGTRTWVKMTAPPVLVIVGTVSTVDELKRQPAAGVIYFVKSTSEYWSFIDGKWVNQGKDEPTSLSEETGAGFIALSSQDSGSTRLKCAEPYYNQLAVFSEYSIQFWNMASDPRNNQQEQILRNTGTISPQTPKQYGDGDILYLTVSGIRSLKARNSSNAAGINDVGSAIDSLIQSEFLRLARDLFGKAFSLVHPLEGRYWLILDDKIYVLSYFPGPGVSAWSIYDPGFTPEYGAPLGMRLMLRANDRLYIYGGLSGAEYDDTVVRVTTPFMHGDKPATYKSFRAIDILGTGTWAMDFGLDARRPDVRQPAGIYDMTTFPMEQMPIEGHSPHICFHLESRSPGYARLAQIAFHYEETYGG